VARTLGTVDSPRLHPPAFPCPLPQGDLERQEFTTLGATLSKLYAEGGPARFFRGLFWRSVNIVGTIYIANEVTDTAITEPRQHTHRAPGTPAPS